jgi:YggT family protein
MASALLYVIDMLFNVVQLLVIGSIIVSWVGADPSNPIVQMLRATTEPMYKPFRALTSKIPGPVDWSPLVLLLVLGFLHRVAIAYIR